MVHARFFIGDDSVEYSFDENQSINDAINELSTIYYEKMGILPIAIFLSPDLYRLATMQNRILQGPISPLGISNVQFHTSNGLVMVKPVFEPKERFIYAGNQQGYENALIDKTFEEIILGE